MMSVEQSVELELPGETEVIGENLPQCHFCPSQNPTWPDLSSNPGRRGGKQATNHLSYGTALVLLLLAELQLLILRSFPQKRALVVWYFQGNHWQGQYH
jgi:hypothetical protein